MTEQARPSAPPPPPPSADGGGSSRRCSTTNNSGDNGPDNSNRRRRPPSSSGVQRNSRRQPPVELAMSYHTAGDQPLPPPPPVSVSRSGSSVRRSSSVGSNQTSQNEKKKRASQTTAGAASADERVMRASSRSNSRSGSSRPPSRSDSNIRESTAVSNANAAAVSELAAAIAATQAELERRQSRLTEIRQRSDAGTYELTIQEEAKQIRKVEKRQRKQKEQIMRMQQGNHNLNDEVGLTLTATASSESMRRNTTGQQRRQSQQRQNSAKIVAVPVPPTNRSARSSVAADEALARKLQNEMLREQEAVQAMEQQFKDEEMARSLAAAEAARMTSLGLSPNDMIDSADGRRGQSSRGGGGFCNTVHRMISCVIMAGCVGVVLFVVFGIVYRSAGGDVEALPPWFRDAWDDRTGWEGDYGQDANATDFQRWRIGKNKKGLKLTLINGLSENWHDHFYQAIEDWNGAGALDLSTVMDNVGPPCEKHTRGMVKTCNDNYGLTDWTGLNELLFENGWIVSSVAMMNEAYLRNARDAERQYVM